LPKIYRCVPTSLPPPGQSRWNDTVKGSKEVEAAIDRLFTYAAYADKNDGQVHEPPLRGVALAMNEPVGVVGVVCPPEAPLLARSASQPR
jgi:acyl-CoA reductase-like NAD-dependent aldehyde dehydrogenase